MFFSDRLCISSKLQTDLKNTGMFSTFLPRPGRACISPYDYSLLDNNEQEKKKNHRKQQRPLSRGYSQFSPVIKKTYREY